MPHMLLDDACPLRQTYNYEDYVAYRTRRTQEIVTRVRKELQKSAQSRKVRYDQNTSVPSAKLGQKVYVIKHIKSGPLFKVSPRFDGPYRIIEILKYSKYRLRHVTDGTERISHWNHLKMIKGDVDFAFVKNTSVDTNVDNHVIPQDEDRTVLHRLRNRTVVSN